MFFDLLELPYPTNREGVLAKLSGEGLIAQTPQGWAISNLAAILLAKRLDAFSPALARKAPRVVIYEGIDKLTTREDKPGGRGIPLASRVGGFRAFRRPAKPLRRAGGAREVKMFPQTGLRELIANALVHQDYLPLALR
jgi:ATP-dependent DNA helicase RecG